VKVISFLLTVVISSAITSGIIWLVAPHHGTVIYRCDWAEITPDIPIEVKNECRKRVLHGTI